MIWVHWVKKDLHQAILPPKTHCMRLFTKPAAPISNTITTNLYFTNPSYTQESLIDPIGFGGEKRVSARTYTHPSKDSQQPESDIALDLGIEIHLSPAHNTFHISPIVMSPLTRA